MNSYEEKWKIKTITGKFKIIPMVVSKTEPVIVNGSVIPYSNEGNLLGLHFNKGEILNQVKHKTNKANVALTTTKRFTELPTNIKLHLIKTVSYQSLHILHIP